MRAELLIRKRIWKLMVVLTALFGAIVARIISLTVIQGEALTARGVRQWTQEGKVEARRGSIVDRNGETLALSTTAYIVSVNPRKVTENAAFAARMAELLDVEQQTILNKLKTKTTPLSSSSGRCPAPPWTPSVRCAHRMNPPQSCCRGCPSRRIRGVFTSRGSFLLRRLV